MVDPNAVVVDRPLIVDRIGLKFVVGRRASTSTDDVPDDDVIATRRRRQQPVVAGIGRRMVGMFALLIVVVAAALYNSWDTPDDDVLSISSYRSIANSILSSQSTTGSVDSHSSTTAIAYRGGGLLTVNSGCRMSKWVYQDDMWGCNSHEKEPRPDVGQVLRNASQLGEHDTVWVPFSQVERFVRDMLTNVTSNVVVISGDAHDARPPSNAAIYKLSSHPRVLKWFCQNLPKYGGGNPFHPKIAPFPYGLHESVRDGYRSFGTYKEVLFGSIQDDTLSNKTNFIFVGPLGVHGNGRRSSMPQSGPMKPKDYFLAMAKSKYVLSPDGDRPECYRHYEAIGLGTVPITQLDPFFYRHLGGGPNGPVIFENAEWNLTLLEKRLYPWPVVRPGMIREDYWMGWVDDVVGFRLNWNTYENGNGLTLLENSLLAMLDWL